MHATPASRVPAAAAPLAGGDGLAQAVAAALLVASLVGAGFTARAVARQRDALQLVVSREAAGGMPPHVALATAALGTFRGLAVDVLWIRADELQNAGQYFEAQTLAQWITSLQPRFPQVWNFQAHNMAYNISVASDVNAERWGWVDRGMQLLRDQGIPLNPGAPQLYDMLAFILHHKVGGRIDRAHWYYKARVAADMQEVLGDMTGGKTTAEALAAFRRVADAPTAIGSIVAPQGELRDLLALLAEHGAAPDEDFLRMLGRVIMAEGSRDGGILFGRGFPAGTNRPLILALRKRPELAAPLFEQLIPHLQKRVLAERFRMDAGRMLALMERYGPLDWRHYDAQSIYWSEQGLEVSRRRLRRDEINELLIVRSRLAAIAELMRTGRVEYDGVTDSIDLLPDPRFIAAYERAIDEVKELIDAKGGLSAAGFAPAEFADFTKAYERFLNEAVVLAFLYGEERKAAECFRRLVLLAREQGMADQPIYRESLETFVTLRLADVLKLDLTKIREFVDAMVQRALLDGLAKGRIDVFNRFVGLAFKIHERHQGSAKTGPKAVLDPNRLGSFADLFATSFEGMMRQGSGPVLERARIWSLAPDELKLRTWKALQRPLAEQAKAAGLDPDRAFPAPPGVDAKKPATADDDEPTDDAGGGPPPGPGESPR